LVLDGDRTETLIHRTMEAWFNGPPDAEGRLRRARTRLQEFFIDTNLFRSVIDEAYEGTRAQRYQLRLLTSSLVGRYIRETRLSDTTSGSNHAPRVEIEDWAIDEVKLLKQITRDYIINSPTLVAQQRGQKRTILTLFNAIYDDSKTRIPTWLPRRLEYLWSPTVTTARSTADCIASLTEAEVAGLNARLQGWSAGSVLDPIVR